MSKKIDRALDVIGLLARLIARIMDAIRSGDERRVDELLRGELASSVAQRIADDEARERFGD